MTDQLDNIHHVGIIPRDMQAAVSTYERLGFVFTPLSLHRITLTPGQPPVEFGTGNRNAIFHGNYLEILGVVDQARWSRIPKAQRGPFDLDARSDLYEGLHVMHLDTSDIGAAKARLEAQHIRVSDVAYLEREVDTPQGPQLMSAQSLHFPPGANPEALIQVAHTLTPELVLQPRFMQHPNQAQAVTEVIVCGDDPQALAEKYAAYTGHAVQQRKGLYLVDLGPSRIVVTQPQQLHRLIPDAQIPLLPFLAGFTLSTGSLEAVRSTLEQAGVPYTNHDGRVIVAAEHACGSAVIFEPQGATR